MDMCPTKIFKKKQQKTKTKTYTRESVEHSCYTLRGLSTTEVLVAKLPLRARLICIIVSLKPQKSWNNLPYLGNALTQVSKILTQDACSVTRFNAKLTFTINVISMELFKIAFLSETIFIFPRHSLSYEGCIVNPESDWLSNFNTSSWACPPSWHLGVSEFLSMAIISLKLKHSLLHANLLNLL